MAADPPQPPQPGAGVLPLLQPAPGPAGHPGQVAGTRWRTEENVAVGKELAGLDEHQVRTCTSWHRWVTLAMLALAFLTVTAAAEHAQPPPPGMIPLTRNEIARLPADPPARPGGTRSRLLWSAWRRRHQHTARTCHHRWQAAHDP
ncbi:MAG TPA: hypothetical protein VEF71_02835 [Streptosporangiaceae bacterium]|nr:hypothetical protein [Streptosporangiaceae bacterium]